MKMTTQERLQSLNDIMVDNIIDGGKKPHEAVLSFTPRIIIFQNFKPNEKIVAKFSIKNISKVGIDFLNKFSIIIALARLVTSIVLATSYFIYNIICN